MDLVEMQSWSFLPSLPQPVGSIRDLLHDYSKIPAEDVDKHLITIREKAWQTSRVPCIGRWKFLNLVNRDDARYQQVLFRLRLPRSNDALLDLGCCLGQALRQLRADGVHGSQLFGTDINPGLINMGYDLFNDRASLGASFVIGDMIDPDDRRLSRLVGRITMVQADSFFHLFTWTEQLFIGKRLVSFLKPDTKNAIIFGRHAGSLKKQKMGGKTQYLHTHETFQMLWNEVGRLTNTRWLVDIEPDGDLSSRLPGIDRHIVPVKFTVHQVP